MLSVIEYNSKNNLQFAEFHCAKPDKRGNKWIYPITTVADGKAKHATKAEQKAAMEWVERKCNKAPSSPCFEEFKAYPEDICIAWEKAFGPLK